MVAHENDALADAASRHQLRLPSRNELRTSEADRSNNKRKSPTATTQRFSGDSDTEDDAPIAAHFSKIMKSERARPSSSSSSSSAGSVSRIDNSQKMYHHHHHHHHHHKTSAAAAASTASARSPLHRQQQQQQNSQPSSAPVASQQLKERDGAKRAKPEAPKFLLLLYEILQMESPKVIRWSEDGLSLQILDPALVTDKILPKYFNHTNFHSFQRQLNYFGFRKWTKSKTDICTFSHPYFRENQPEMLQLIKRKKAPRRTPVADKVEGYCNQLDDKKVPLPQSPTGKRKLSAADDEDRHQRHHHSNPVVSQSQSHHHQQQQLGGSASNVSIHPALHGVSVAPLSQHHREQGSLQYLPASALLNNVISPLAASECHKKAKKIDKKAYLATTSVEFQHQQQHRHHASSSSSSSDPTATSMCEMAAMQQSANVYSNASSGGSLNSSHSLPTLDIVRSRIIRRQNVSNQAHASANASSNEQYASVYQGYASPLAGISAATAQMLEATRASEVMNPMTPVGGDRLKSSSATSSMNLNSPAGFTNSFSDPVDILLRIKKSRTMSSSDGHLQTPTQIPNQLKELLSPEAKHAAGDQQDNLASLHNFLISHTLYTNRLESQLKMALEENDALKQLADAKHREVEALQSERKMLQNENGVLVEDKLKLIEINRELLSKLFPQ